MRREAPRWNSPDREVGVMKSLPGAVATGSPRALCRRPLRGLKNVVAAWTPLFAPTQIARIAGLTPDRHRLLHDAPYSSRDGFERKRLICERRDFSSSVRFFALRGMRVRTRLAGR